MASFKTENLSFTYPQRNKKALDGVSLNISDGEFIVLMGKTGSGKSTLLKLLKKELAPFGNIEGSIDVSSENIGFVPQNPDVTFVAQTVRSELAFALIWLLGSKRLISKIKPVTIPPLQPENTETATAIQSNAEISFLNLIKSPSCLRLINHNNQRDSCSYHM